MALNCGLHAGNKDPAHGLKFCAALSAAPVSSLSDGVAASAELQDPCSAAEQILFVYRQSCRFHTAQQHWQPCTEAGKITVAQEEEEGHTAGFALLDRPVLFWSPFLARSRKSGLRDDQCAVWQLPDLGGGLQAPRLRFSWGVGLLVPQVAADCTPHRLQHRLTAKRQHLQHGASGTFPLRGREGVNKARGSAESPSSYQQHEQWVPGKRCPACSRGLLPELLGSVLVLEGQPWMPQLLDL